MKNRTVWKDLAGKDIQAHGGCIIEYDGKYYWTIVKKVDRGMRKISKAQPRHAGRTKVQPD